MSSSRRSESSSKVRSSEKAKSKDRVSVFSRLGIKGPSSSSTSSTTKVERTHQTPTCRQWLESGQCTYGSKCKSASTHTPKKLAKRPNTIKVRKDSKSEKRSPNIPGDVDWSKWDEKNLDREDERSLEKKRQLLERELAKQLAEEDKKSAGGREFGPPPAKKLKTGIDKRPNSSSSSSSGSSSSSSSGSWDSTSETSSESDTQRTSKVVEKKKVARRSNSEDSKKTMTSKESSSSSSTKNQALASQDNTRRSISTVGKPTKLKAVTKVAAKRPRSPTDVKRVKKKASSNKSPHDRTNVSHKGLKESVPASRSWKGKRSRDSSTRRSLSPSRPVVSESRTKLKKVAKSGVKRSLSQDRRRQSPGRSLNKRSSHSPTQRRRPPSPSKSRPAGVRGISRDRDHRPAHPRDEPRDIRDTREGLDQRDIRDIRDSRDSRLPRDVRNFRGDRDGHHRDARDVRREEVFRVKHDRDRKTTPQNPSRLQPGGHRDGWNRYPPLQSERDDRSHKSPSTRDLGISSMRPSDTRKIRESSGDVRHGFREKGKLREGNRSPRDQILHPDAYRHKMRDHDHSPRDRLINPDNRDPMNQDLSGSLKRERERDRGSSEFTQKQTSPFDRHGGHYNRRESGSHDGPFLSSNQLNKSDTLNSPKRGDTNPRKWAPDTIAASGQQIRDSSLRPTSLLSPTDKRNSDGLQEDSTLPTKSIAKSPLPSHDAADKQEYFSDLEINDSDEEILNKLNPNDNEEGQYATSVDVIDDETEEGEVGAVESRSSSRKSNLNDVLGISESGSKAERANDLLEGISDEDLETCEEDEKTHIADALGVDWSMLMSNKTELENHSSTDIKKRMSVISIFNRIGLSKKYLGSFYDEVVSEINSKAEEGEKLELLDDIGGLHQRMLNLREKRRKLFSSSGPYVIPHKVDLII